MSQVPVVDQLLASASAWLVEWATWENAKNFGNSSFFTALIGSLAGAFAGAIAAQRIVERSKAREELLQKILSTNAALSVAFSIISSLLSLKKQHVKALKETFESDRAAIKEHKRKRLIGQIQGNAEYRFTADFRSIPQTTLPTLVLQDLVFFKAGVMGRPLALVSAIQEAVALLNGSIIQRNLLIEKFKLSAFEAGADNVSLYFGLPYGGGHLNQEYPDSISAISSYVDDGIFFTHLLAADLQNHGNLLLTDFRKRFRGKSPRVTELHFDKAAEDDLMPSIARYEDWLKSFSKHE
jgi:hypothetical protein